MQASGPCDLSARPRAPLFHSYGNLSHLEKVAGNEWDGQAEHACLSLLPFIVSLTMV